MLVYRRVPSLKLTYPSYPSYPSYPLKIDGWKLEDDSSPFGARPILSGEVRFQGGICRGSSPLRQFARLMLITRYGAGKAEVWLV